MRKKFLLICGVLFTGSLVAYLILTNGASHHDDVDNGDDRVTSTLEDHDAESSSKNASEVARLKAELRRKDLTILAMKMDRNQAVQQAQESEESLKARANPAKRAADILDERLSAPPADVNRAREMKRALQDAIDAIELDDTQVDTLHCGGSNLCRLTLASSNADVLNKSVAELSRRFPTEYVSGTLVVPLADGRKAIYLAETSEDLNTEPEEAESEARIINAR